MPSLKSFVCCRQPGDPPNQSLQEYNSQWPTSTRKKAAPYDAEKFKIIVVKTRFRSTRTKFVQGGSRNAIHSSTHPSSPFHLPAGSTCLTPLPPGFCSQSMPERSCGKCECVKVRRRPRTDSQHCHDRPVRKLHTTCPHLPLRSPCPQRGRIP
jgi:hypothetical protein